MSSLKNFLRDIKLSHSIFAMPFAFSAIFVSDITVPSAVTILWLFLAIVFARSFAMGMNRWMDRDIDSRNDRTKARLIPAGLISARSSLTWTGVFGLSFLVVAFQLSLLAGLLSVPLLFVLAFYSQMKKVSWLTHFYLGFCLGVAPLALEVALTGQVSLSTSMLGLGILFWTSGFDIFYSLQDVDFDREEGLKSVPSKFGNGRAIRISQFCFIGALLSFLSVGILADFGSIYFIFIFLIGCLLTIESQMVAGSAKKVDVVQINKAFFTVNAWISVVYLVGVVLDRNL